MLERAWRLPAAPGAAKPPAGPGLLRGLGLAGAVVAGALLNSSGGELAWLQLQGKVPLDIGLGQWQRAGSAFARWNPGWRMPAAVSPQQVGRAVRQAAELDAKLSGRQITPQRFAREMGLLVAQLLGGSAPQATRVRETGLSARASRTVPAPHGVASKAPPARLPEPGRSDAGRPPRPGLPPRRYEIAHTRGPGMRAGAGAAELEQRAMAQRAEALQIASEVYRARSRTLLFGSREDLARQAHAEHGGARALGLSEDAFVARVQAPGPILGTDAAGRVSAGPAGAGAGPASGPRGQAPRGRERAIVLAINTLVNDTIRAKLSSLTLEGRDRLVELLARRDWDWTHLDSLVLPGASDRLPPMPVSIRLRRVDGGVHVNARLEPARNVEALTGSLAYFAPLGKPATAFFVDHTLPLRGGRIVLPGEARTADPALVNPWGAGGLPNASGQFGLPANFFAPRLDARTFSRQIASAPGLDASWVPSTVQHRQFMNLFTHRQALETLLNARHPSHDAALGQLADTLRAMDQHPITPVMFPAELSFHVFPANRAGSEWGIGFGALGQDRGVDTFPTRLGAGFGERPPEPGITTLHTHPTSDRPQLSGFSLGDVSCVLSTGTSLAVYDNGVAMRIRLDDAWFESSVETRRARADGLDSLSKQFEALKARQDRLEAAQPDPVRQQAESRSIASELLRLTREARRQLGELPIVFEVIGSVPHPERTVAVGILGMPLLPLSQARTR
ncbi:MAG: hypothetical protein ACK5PW_04190 [Burkholderiales bacterium]|jgi:hypothetical protein